MALSTQVSCSSVNATDRVVTLDLTACKSGATISWVCCRSTACTPVSCTQGPLVANNFPTCENVTSYSFSVPLTTTSIPIQVGR